MYKQIHNFLKNPKYKWAETVERVSKREIEIIPSVESRDSERDRGAARERERIE